VQTNIKDDIISLVSALREDGKTYLADCILNNWQKTALAYSKELNTYTPAQPMEPELMKAFEKELERLGTRSDLKVKILESLEKRRVLQTAPHLGVAESPRMLAINWLGSLGVEGDEFYVVGMFSGIPFSNSSRPGRINLKKDSVNLFPSSMQDDLVFRSKIPEKLVTKIATLPEKLRKLLPPAVSGDSYTKWALTACSNIENKILGKKNLVYLDINEVATNYWENIKEKKDHPVNKLRKTEKSNLLLTFLPLLLNHFKCFGSFRQVEYLPRYQEKLAGLEFMKNFAVDTVPTTSLTTLEFVDNPHPADIILGEKFEPNEEALFGELLLNMKETLLKK